MLLVEFNIVNLQLGLMAPVAVKSRNLPPLWQYLQQI